MTEKKPRLTQKFFFAVKYGIEKPPIPKPANDERKLER